MLLLLLLDTGSVQDALFGVDLQSDLLQFGWAAAPYAVLLAHLSPFFVVLVGVELPAFTAIPLDRVKVPREVEELLALLRYPALCFQLGPRLTPLQDSVVLLGVDVKWLFI